MKIDIDSIRNHIHTLSTDEERFEFLNNEFIRITNIEMNSFFIPLIERNAIPQKNIVSKTDDGKILAVYETKKIPKEEESEYFNNKFALMKLREDYRVKVEEKEKTELIKQTADKYKLIEWVKGLQSYVDGNPRQEGKKIDIFDKFFENLKEHNEEYKKRIENKIKNDGKNAETAKNDIRTTFKGYFQDREDVKKRKKPTYEEIEMFLHL